jgi:hypothetical protein
VPGLDPGIDAVVSADFGRNGRAISMNYFDAETRGYPGQARARARSGAPGFLVLFSKKELLS